MPVTATLANWGRAEGSPSGVMTPLMMMANRPSSSSGVRILPTMSTTADSLMHSARISAKNRMENTTGLTPDRLGTMAIS